MTRIEEYNIIKQQGHNPPISPQKISTIGIEECISLYSMLNGDVSFGNIDTFNKVNDVKISVLNLRILRVVEGYNKIDFSKIGFEEWLKK